MVKLLMDGPTIVVDMNSKEIIPNVASANEKTGTYHTYSQEPKHHPQMLHHLKSHKSVIRIMNINDAIEEGFELIS